MIKDFENAVRDHEKKICRSLNIIHATKNLEQARKNLEDCTPGPNDAAVILRGTGTHTFTISHVIPIQDDDAEVPSVSMLASMISILISQDDKQFIGLIYKKIKEYMEMVDNEDSDKTQND